MIPRGIICLTPPWAISPLLYFSKFWTLKEEQIPLSPPLAKGGMGKMGASCIFLFYPDSGKY